MNLFAMVHFPYTLTSQRTTKLRVARPPHRIFIDGVQSLSAAVNEDLLLRIAKLVRRLMKLHYMCATTTLPTSFSRIDYLKYL